MRFSPTQRRGLTLIELLVVIGLILVLIVLAVTISPRISEDQRSARAADHLQQWLLTAKQRAYRDQQARGIRLVVDPANPTQVTELVYIERPEDYQGGICHVPAPAFVLSYDPPSPLIGPATTFTAGATVFIENKDLTNNDFGTAMNALFPVTLVGHVNPPIVEPLDFLVFNVLEPIPYNSHRILEVTHIPPSSNPQGRWGTRLLLASVDGTHASVVNNGFPVTVDDPRRFRFVRKPRPLVGETPMTLPRDMIIDVTVPIAFGGTGLAGGGESYFPSRTPTSVDYDILFSPRGQIIGPNSIGGKIILRLRNRDRGPLEGDQTLVTVYTRSGFIATHPLHLEDLFPVDGVLDDPFKFTKDGNSSGL